MCRLLAKINTKPQNAVDEILQSANSLKVQAARQQKFGSQTMGPHKDGAGIAWVENGDVNVFKVSREGIWSEIFCQKVHSINSNFFVVHVREASPGLRVDESCAHPFLGEFQGQPLAFCHNGGINSYYDEAKLRGITDSQIYLERIIGSLQTLELESLAECLRTISSGWRYSSAIAILCSAKRLFAWRMINPLAPAVNHTADIYTLYYKISAESCTIASENLDNSQNWIPINNREIFCLELGQENIIFKKTLI